MTILEYKQQAVSNINSIPEEYTVLLADLAKAESNELHYNRITGEKDITTGLGIYRFAQPKAEIFKYIDLVAKQVTKLPSSTWDEATINKVDSLCDKDILMYLSYLFYKEYYAPLCLELLPNGVVVDACNLYANSPRGATLSIQRAIFELNDMGYISLPKENIYEPIPTIGPKTKFNLKKIKQCSKDVHKVFNMLILLYMKTYYINIITSDKVKLNEAAKIIPALKNLKGWDNRVNNAID